MPLSIFEGFQKLSYLKLSKNIIKNNKNILILNFDNSNFVKNFKNIIQINFWQKIEN